MDECKNYYYEQKIFNKSCVDLCSREIMKLFRIPANRLFYHMQIFAFQKRVRARDMVPEALYGCETHRKARHRTRQTISETYPKHSANGYLGKKLRQFCSGRFCLPLTVPFAR